ncbi:MAG: PucR family transcriptional regulator, partial [Clostridia bacterium]|nr:PucR family transcriptional regulator [Clostridia bacterium]
MSNRLFQGVIHQMKDAVDRTIGVIDETAITIACSELGKIGEVNEDITTDMMTSSESFALGGYTFQSFGNKPRMEYAVFVEG